MPLSMKSQWVLDPSVVFLNHGSFGACPRQIMEFQSDLRIRIETQPVQFFRRELEESLRASLLPLAELLDASVDQLAFIPNATYGVNSILQSFDWRPDDVICYLDHEYNATANAIESCASRFHLKTCVIKLPFKTTGFRELLDIICSQVPDPCRMFVFDAITSPSAWVLPSAELAAWCQQRGIATLIDGAHVPGQIQFSIRNVKPTFFVGNCHKWLCTPKGSAVLYASEEYGDRIRPVSVSHGYNSTRTSLSRFHEAFFWTGTFDPTPWLCVPMVLDFLNNLHPDGLLGVMRYNHEPLVAARRQIGEALALDSLAPDEMLGSMCSFDVSSLRDDFEIPESFELDLPLQSYLLRHHRIEVPVLKLHDKGTILRISMYLYNEKSDIERLVNGLAMIGSIR